MATNDTFKLSVVGRLQNQDYVHTLHFREIAPAIPPTDTQWMNDLIDDWQANCRAAWLGIQGGTYALVRERVDKVCGALPLPAPVEQADAGVGTRPGTPLLETPSWFACKVKESGESAGRRSQGRFFTWVPEEGDFVVNTLQPTYLASVAAYTTTLARFLSGGLAAGVRRLVVYSRKAASAIPPPQCQNSSTLVASYTVDTLLTTQRSRRARPQG